MIRSLAAAFLLAAAFVLFGGAENRVLAEDESCIVSVPHCEYDRETNDRVYPN